MYAEFISSTVMTRNVGIWEKTSWTPVTLLADITERPGGPALGAKLQQVETLQRILGEQGHLWPEPSYQPTNKYLLVTLCRVVKIHIIKTTSSFRV